MTLIADKDRETIRELLDKELADSVDLLLFTRPRSRVYVPGRQDCQTCEETRELLEELSVLSDKLSLTTRDLSVEPEAAADYHVQHLPTVLVRRGGSSAGPVDRTAPDGPTQGDGAQAAEPPAAGADAPAGQGASVRFLGLPSGYEFSTLLADVVDVSKGRTDLSEATRAAVRAIDQPVHIQVFVTPT